MVLVLSVSSNCFISSSCSDLTDDWFRLWCGDDTWRCAFKNHSVVMLQRSLPLTFNFLYIKDEKFRRNKFQRVFSPKFFAAEIFGIVTFSSIPKIQYLKIIFLKKTFRHVLLKMHSQC